MGQLGEIYPGGRQRVGFQKPGRSGELRLWIEHLALCASGAEVSHSLFVGRADGGTRAVRFRQVSDAASLLEGLVRLYRQGMRDALPFFPKSSRAYAVGYASAKSTEDPHHKGCKRAYGELMPTGFRHTEGEDLYHQLAHDHRLERYVRSDDRESSAAFAELALHVFEPLLEHREEVGR